MGTNLVVARVTIGGYVKEKVVALRLGVVGVMGVAGMVGVVVGGGLVVA